MKALVISERPEIIDFVTPLLKDKGFDIIHYKWIIKALDNIEEIQPDVIVLSAGEYPRHWKTLAGFVQSGIGGNDVKVYLYETKPLSVEDVEKAESLGVKSFEDDFRKAEIVEVVFNNTDGALNFCNGKYYKDQNLLEIEYQLTNGSYLKYLTMSDGNRVVSFSARVEKVAEGISSLKVNEL